MRGPEGAAPPGATRLGGLPRGVEEILGASPGHKRWRQSESQGARQGVQEQERPGKGGARLELEKDTVSCESWRWELSWRGDLLGWPREMTPMP